MHTPTGKVVVYQRSTGRRYERWPDCAQDLLDSGEFTADPPNSDVPTVPAAPVSPAAPQVAENAAPAAPNTDPPARPRRTRRGR